MELSLCPKLNENCDVFSILNQDHSVYLSGDVQEYILLKEKTKSAAIIQKAWRKYSDKKIYASIKNKLYYFSQEDPVRLLKWKNPIEAQIFERKLGYRLVFRLDGATFPPIMVYKIFVAVGIHRSTERTVEGIKEKRKAAKTVPKTSWRSFYVYKSQAKLQLTNRKRKFAITGIRKVKKNQGIKWITDMYS